MHLGVVYIQLKFVIPIGVVFLGLDVSGRFSRCAYFFFLDVLSAFHKISNKNVSSAHY